MKSSFGPTYCRVTWILLCQNDPHRKQCPMEGSEGKPVHPKQIGLSRLTGLLGVRTQKGRGSGSSCQKLPWADCSLSVKLAMELVWVSRENAHWAGRVVLAAQAQMTRAHPPPTSQERVLDDDNPNNVCLY